MVWFCSSCECLTLVSVSPARTQNSLLLSLCPPPDGHAGVGGHADDEEDGAGDEARGAVTEQPPVRPPQVQVLMELTSVCLSVRPSVQ